MLLWYNARILPALQHIRMHYPRVLYATRIAASRAGVSNARRRIVRSECRRPEVVFGRTAWHYSGTQTRARGCAEAGADRPCYAAIAVGWAHIGAAAGGSRGRVS